MEPGEDIWVRATLLMVKDTHLSVAVITARADKVREEYLSRFPPKAPAKAKTRGK